MVIDEKTKGKKPQHLLKVYNWGQDPCETEAHVNFNVEVYKGHIKVKKYGVWNGDNEAKILKGMDFKVYCPELKKWVKGGKNKKAEERFADSIEDAKTYTTDEDGIITIKNIYGGDHYRYELVEVGGNKKYYTNPISVTKDTNPQLTIKHNKYEFEEKPCYSFQFIKLPEKLPEESGSTVEFEIYDDPTYGDLKIIKDDTNNTNRDQKQIEIKIRNEDKGWLKLGPKADAPYDYRDLTEDTFGSYYTNDSNEAGTFVTDKNGEIQLKHLEVGTYTIWETKTTDIQYNIKEQGEEGKYDSNIKAAYLGEVKINDQTTSVKATYEQKERKRGSIKITKTGVWNGNIIKDQPLPKMSFKVYSDNIVDDDQHKVAGQNWVYHRTIKNESNGTEESIIDFTNDFNEAEVFTTNADGVIEIDGLYLDFNDYKLVEVPTIVGEGGRQNIYYIDPILLDDKYNNGNAGEMEINGETYCTIENVKIQNDTTPLAIEIADSPTYGDLKIIKKGTNNPSRLLRNVEIKIKSLDRPDNNAWLKAVNKNHDGVYDFSDFTDDTADNYYTSFDDESTIFKTDEEGVINLKHIQAKFRNKLNGVYEIWETKTFGIEYDISEQGIQGKYDEERHAALLGTVTISDETTTVEVSYNQPERLKANLKIKKKGIYGENGELIEEPLPKMSFKVYSNTTVPGDVHKVDGQKWVIHKEDPELYPDGPIVDFTSNFDEAEVFTTDEKGEITINGLYLDFNNYTLVEVPTKVKEGEKENTYYIDPIVIDGKYNNNASRETINGTEYCIIKDVEVKYGTVIEIEIKDNRTSADLTIEKYDYTYKDYALEGAQFKIQLVKAQYLKDVDGMWLKALPDGSLDYTNVRHEDYLTSNVDEAGVFTTDANGKIAIKSIANGVYQAYEVKAPHGYDITRQDGYEAENGWVKIPDTVDITTENNIVKYKCYNKKVATAVEGDVWVDLTRSKQNVINNIYDEGLDDLLKEPITVKIHSSDGGVIATTQTTADSGYKHYRFTKRDNGEDLSYWELANSYVEFIYDNKYTAGAEGQEKFGYVTVDPFAGTDAKINSKAQEYTMPIEKLDDDKLTGTSGDYPGQAVTNRDSMNLSREEILNRNTEIEQKINSNSASRSDLEDEPLTSYYDTNTFIIGNINLGLIEKHDPDYVISETLAYTKIIMNGYTYTYKYGGTPATNSGFAPQVHEQTSTKSYTGAIYPSDIAYNADTDPNKTGEGLRVYVVYRIDVHNLESMNVYNRYVETIENETPKGKLYLKSLVNWYDKNRYILSNDDNSKDSNDFKYWNDEDGDGIADFNIEGSENNIADGIKAQDTKTVLVQYKLQETFLQDILKGSVAMNDEGMASQATSEAYHEYLRKDNLWHHDGAHTFDGCKGRDVYNPASSDYIHKSRLKEDKSARLSMVFKLGEQRTLTGTVFEDIVTNESKGLNENLGNGIIEGNEENRMEAVKVELLDLSKANDTNGNEPQLATIYPKNDEGVYEAKGAITATNDKGNYTFEGIVPGVYLLRFTYGDGTQKMKTVNGEEINPQVKLNDYRSTIINTDVNGAGNYIQNAKEKTNDEMKNNQKTLIDQYYSEPETNPNSIIDTDEQKLSEWYKYITNNYYSIATDDLEEREKIKDYVYKDKAKDEKEGEVYNKENENVTEDYYKSNMFSESPIFGISIENDTSKYADQKNAITDNAGETGAEYDSEMHIPLYGNFNFGLIKEINTELKVNMEITNVDFTLSNSTKLVSANPKDDNKPIELSDLDERAKDMRMGSKYAKLEIAQDLLYSSELATTYELTIKNNTVKDYIEAIDNPYYGYYFKYGDKSKNEYLKEVTVKEVTDWLDNKYTYDFVTGKVSEFVNHMGESRTGIKEINNAEAEIDKKDDKSLVITEWDPIEKDGTTKIRYIAKSRLSSNLKDTNFANEIKISAISLDYLSTLTSSWDWANEDIKDNNAMVITTDTGEDRRPTYWVAGTVALSILAVGIIVLIIILKKKSA